MSKNRKTIRRLPSQERARTTIEHCSECGAEAHEDGQMFCTQCGGEITDACDDFFPDSDDD